MKLEKVFDYQKGSTNGRGLEVVRNLFNVIKALQALRETYFSRIEVVPESYLRGDYKCIDSADIMNECDLLEYDLNIEILFIAKNDFDDLYIVIKDATFEGIRKVIDL